MKKENLLAFAADNTMIDDTLMKINRDGITFIYEMGYSDILYRSSDCKAGLIGFVADGTFYSTQYKYREIDKDFDAEIIAFEDKFNAMYAEYISRYNTENLAPVTENTDCDKWHTMEQRINDYKENYLQRQAIDRVFDICTGKENFNDCDYHKSEMTPIFLDYLINGESVIEKHLAAKAEKEAESINYRILTEIECNKEAEKLMQNKAFMQRVDLYGKLKKLNAKTVKVTLDISETIFEDLKIDLHELIAGIRYRGKISIHNFTYNEQQDIKNARKAVGEDMWKDISIEDIIKITYRTTTVYEKRMEEIL